MSPPRVAVEIGNTSASDAIGEHAVGHRIRSAHSALTRSTERGARGVFDQPGCPCPRFSARREWSAVRHVAYDLRHSFASLEIRAGLSTPELAEQLGHSPQMTLLTSADEQIRVAREARRPLEDLFEAPPESSADEKAASGDSSGWIRTTDLAIMSGAL
jgi:hypothetical protein